jgi:hypothetical protein
MIESHKFKIFLIRIRLLDFPILSLFIFEFVSDFDIRISNFE